MTEKELIQACLQEDRLAQKRLYDRYAPLLFSVSRRYLSREEAEEALLSTMFKIMTQLGKYSGEGNFEGWMRRIAVNESLMILRGKKLLTFPMDDQLESIKDESVPIEAELSAKEILSLLESLPPGYRTVFNLFVLEGYKHHEIADALGVSINTSKSQLIAAKKRLQELVLEHYKMP